MVRVCVSSVIKCCGFFVLTIIILSSAAFSFSDLPSDISFDSQKEDSTTGFDVLKDILNSNEKVLHYFNKNYQNINLDGIIGLRISEGQIGSLLARYWTRLPFWAVAQMRELQKLAHSITTKSIPYVMEKTPHYYKKAHQMLANHFWSLYYPKHSIKSQLVYRGHKNSSSFNERFSDNCIEEFHNSSGTACAVSEECWNQMMLPQNFQGYSLTHQVFYLLNGIQANCLDSITKMAKKSQNQEYPVRHLLDQFCSNVFHEAVLIDKSNYPYQSRDLFMEQIGLCGMAGYLELVQWSWWPEIKSWQRDSGCFGSFKGEHINPKNFDAETYGNNRRKRVESLMSDDGCLSHRSSVALCAMTSFIRRVVEDNVYGL